MDKTFYKKLKHYIIHPTATNYAKKSSFGIAFTPNINLFFKSNTKFYVNIIYKTNNREKKFLRKYKNTKDFFNQLKEHDKDGLVSSYFILNNITEQTTSFPKTHTEKLFEIFSEMQDLVESLGKFMS